MRVISMPGLAAVRRGNAANLMSYMSAKILVMDDDEVIRELVKLHLSRAGYEVLVAEDGVGGGLALQNQRPDLVLVDIDMPHFNGLELLKSIKSDPSVKRIPVMLITPRRTRRRKPGASVPSPTSSSRCAWIACLPPSRNTRRPRR